MEKMPTPARKRVTLPADGAEFATVHTYVRTERRPDAKLGELHPEYAFIFRCTKTGKERVYGVEDATPRTTEMVNAERTEVIS